MGDAIKPGGKCPLFPLAGTDGSPSSDEYFFGNILGSHSIPDLIKYVSIYSVQIQAVKLAKGFGIATSRPPY
jgi:hypothetical protein